MIIKDTECGDSIIWSQQYIQLWGKDIPLDFSIVYIKHPPKAICTLCSPISILIKITFR